jgi:hypothetical protein
MSTLPGRRIRRRMLKANGFFKSKNQLSFKDRLKLSLQTRERGAEYSKTNTDAMDKNIAEQLETKEVAMITTWKEFGYDENEIELLRSAWATLTVKYLPTWKQDKKDAREAINKAKKLYLERTE